MQLSNLVAYIGTYSSTTTSFLPGGVHVWSLSADGRNATPIQFIEKPSEAGYLFYAKNLSTLYVVDEKKTDGRGPVSAPASVHAFDVNLTTAELTWKNSQISPGANPTFLDYSAKHNALFIIQYSLANDGTIAGLQDVVVLDGHGPDPNGSPQSGGHAQASAHAHSASVDPSDSFLAVADKGADRIYIYHVDGETLEPAYVFNATAGTGPRHVAWSQKSDPTWFFVTYELSSEVASFQIDPETGSVTLLDVVSSVGTNFSRYNEPADIQVHPTNERLVYVNNRGEDTIAWFNVDDAGKLSLLGSVMLTQSLNAGVAARSFRFSPAGDFLLVADRPENAIRAYSVDQGNGNLEQVATWAVSEPAFVCIVEF
ncbi:hypothetical protein PFICI_08686 [Pestalotiopsis fici W106-1]|uniref:6-phosphogluconolactonase n=1 Tax=Pestalotiopsis fici (strain W106-1 / CGMCC3.15140) TaxID=1229662 RepID=W3WY83_PESFW|nr:uncharacterized protein PFICI_08686 [Pestalotiopsis fici W106-1]ETS78833.1 hypothetical protein PFICI_08686 [Pestalotiopsis fici W106-1]